MKKLLVFGILFLFLFFSGFTENTKKKSRRVKALIEKIDLRLDSIIQTQVYETIQGHKYHRFNRGVLTANSGDISGVFIIKDRVHFTSHNGEIVFSGIDETGRCYRKTLEQFLFALEEPW